MEAFQFGGQVKASDALLNDIFSSSTTEVQSTVEKDVNEEDMSSNLINNGSDSDSDSDSDAPFGFLGIEKPQANAKPTPDINTDEAAEKSKHLSEEEQRERAERTIFVGNLPSQAKSKHLKKHFKDVGEIESIRFRTLTLTQRTVESKHAVKIRNQIATDLSSINAYVVFKSKDSISSALELNGSELLGRIIRVDSVEQGKKPHFDHTRTIFVGNLPFDATVEEIRGAFEQLGDITGVRIVRDAKLGVGKGFAYVEFEVSESVELALLRNDIKVKKRAVRVKKCLSQRGQEKRKKKTDDVQHLTGAAGRLARKQKKEEEKIQEQKRKRRKTQGSFKSRRPESNPKSNTKPSRAPQRGSKTSRRPFSSRKKKPIVLDHRGKKPRHKPRNPPPQSTSSN